jgi:hypothetical protein
LSSNPTTCKPLEMAKRVGIESARQRNSNNMQGHGWHKSTWKAVVD